jgi:hypothetical protein
MGGESEKLDEFHKMSKKAMKIWNKAKTKMNENRESYLNRSKWLNDIQKLEYQYENNP